MEIYLKTILLMFVLMCGGCKAPTLNINSKKEGMGSIQRIAVIPFSDAPGAEAGYSGQAVAGVIADELSAVSGIQVIEREHLKSIVKEQGLRFSDISSQESVAIEVGKVLGVDAILTGATSQYDKSSLGLGGIYADIYKVGMSVRLIRIDTSEVCFTGSFSSDSTSNFQEATLKCVKPIIDAFGKEMSAARLISPQKPLTGSQQLATIPKRTVSSEYPRQNLNANTWGVVIGISNYNLSDNIITLVFADDDATAFANQLKRQGLSDSHIKVLTNEQATQRNVMIALENWLTKAGPDDMIVLFWSGHGFPDPEDPEKVYFACYDTDPRIPATGYRMDRVRDALEERGCRNVIVFADTCHAGKIVTRGDDRAIGIMPYMNSITKKQNVPKGWIFMVSSDADRKAIEDSSWSHGAFTHCLLKALSGEADGYQSIGLRDGRITMGEVRAYMTAVMPDETQKVLGVAKHPVITTSTGDPEIWNLSLR